MSTPIRTLAQVNADIATATGRLKDLEQERRIVQRDAVKKQSAIQVLENLGWKFSGGKWEKPEEVTTVRARYHSDKGPIREGDFATWDNKILGGNVIVRNLIPGSDKALVSWISNVGIRGCTAGRETFTVDVADLTPRHRHWFIGK